MQITVNRVSPVVVELQVEVPPDVVKAEVDKAYATLSKKAFVKGFRPGKVPPNLIRKMHGDALHQEALQNAVQQGVQGLLSEQKLRPAMQPEVELDEGYAPGKDAEIKVRLETLPDVPKPKIDKLQLERLTVEADDKVVDTQLKTLASSQKSWKAAPKAKPDRCMASNSAPVAAI